MRTKVRNIIFAGMPFLVMFGFAWSDSVPLRVIITTVSAF